jgi:hypothetical protein
MDKIIAKIQAKLANKEDVLSELAKLTNPELNSFLLELFRIKSQRVNPSEVVKQFNENRFVSPADTNILKLKEIEVEWLTYAEENGYEPLNLSPLAPFAACSSVGLVNQNNVVTALRGTEVVSDATNVIALKIASEFKAAKDRNLILKYSTTHRHIRGQYFSNPNFSAHFSVFCLVAGGLDNGNYEFEISQLEEHIRIMFSLLKRRFNENQLFIKFLVKEISEQFHSILKQRENLFWADKEVVFVEDFDNKYYKTIQYKIGIKKNNQEIEIADGGDVDWTQKLLGNRKHRLFISGIGLDLMEKI